MSETMALTDIGTIKEVLARHGFTFSKKWGQNFLINPSVCPRMAAASGADKQSGVLEIGPGIGVLTKELAKVAGKVVAVEVDERLPAVLKETLADYDNVTVLLGDVLKVDLAAVLREQFGDRPVAVCANLPYYITSPVIMQLLEDKLPIRSVTVMGVVVLSLRPAHPANSISIAKRQAILDFMGSLLDFFCFSMSAGFRFIQKSPTQ